MKLQREEEQRQHEEEQRRRVAELTAHFEKEIKHQQFQLRMQKTQDGGEEYPVRTSTRHHKEERREKKKKRKKKKSKSGLPETAREGKLRKRKHHHSHREHRKAASEGKGDGVCLKE